MLFSPELTETIHRIFWELRLIWLTLMIGFSIVILIGLVIVYVLIDIAWKLGVVENLKLNDKEIETISQGIGWHDNDNRPLGPDSPVYRKGNTA